ncbi:AMP-binding protein [Piscinibacter gummiphilus]|uniref:Long-chain-fatty-acid--CoA ligase n=1 Tax=Piscinibacter gummiphilus TaxID=946333 RepID=A0A1W6L5U4_9BURK|nr:AMP-binding protein [Piscinibacter gummiphilus]ARN19665.1 long-chain-fatty-acid--CoA ligase [Piscinibacter gummiphilus]ATU64333.1 long-chain-fatty-acid--CoA ligase [Piscinibacter gummiphilus]
MQERPWLKTYREFGIPPEVGPEAHTTVTAMLEAAMVRHADRPAFRFAGQTLRYADVDRLSRDFAAWLQSQGVRAGDRVAVMLPNVLAFPVAMLGILRAGAVQVNVNPLYTPRELEHQLLDAGVETLVVFNGSTATLGQVLGRTGLRRVITVGFGLASAASPGDPPVHASVVGEGTIALGDALARGASLPFTPVPLGRDDLIFLQYTGGTTGVSKGAALTHGNLLANRAQFALFMPDAMREGEEVVVTAIPLYHIFALMVNFITYASIGAENWLVPNPRDMDAFVGVLQQARPTVITGVNTLYAGLVQHPGLRNVDWSRLRLSVGGGAAIVPTVSSRWQQVTGRFIREGYGLSETSPVASFNPAAVAGFTGTTGLPMPSTDIRLLDDAGCDVAEGEAGEVCIRGPQVMRGYWGRPEADVSAFTGDGYFRTGDVGVFDARGFLKIVDRKKDMIVVSGFNVYPNEVEAVASACPGVSECACVGVPDEKSGEAVCLVVVRLPAASLTEAQVVAHCRSGLAGYKLPKVVRFVDALPKSTVGKVLRRELRVA